MLRIRNCFGESMNDGLLADSQGKIIRVSAIMTQDIRYHWKRAGMPIWQIMRLIDPKPDELTTDIVNGWVACRATHAAEAHWRLVIEVMTKLPDATKNDNSTVKRIRGGRPKGVDGTKRIIVTPDMHAHFLNELKRTGADITIDLADSEDAPVGLNYRVIQILKLNEAKTIRDDFWEFIVRKLAIMADLRGYTND